MMDSHSAGHNLLRLRFVEGIDPKFAYHFMTSPVLRGHLASATSATTMVAAIYQKILMKAFRQPDIEQQEVIVRRIDAAVTRIDRMTEDANRFAHLHDRLDERILVKAFRGKLVHQDPEDEPAEALSACIREARAAASKQKRGRRKKVTT